jgi:hypothetical protein
MRYWSHLSKDWVIAVKVLMSPLNWVEITKEEFDERRKANGVSG